MIIYCRVGLLAVLKAILPPIQLSLKDMFSNQLLVVAIVKYFSFEPCTFFSVNCVHAYYVCMFANAV